MSAPDELPGHIAAALTELFKSAIAHPDVYADHARVSAKISDIRNCVENAISTVLPARNEALGRPLMTLPSELLLLIFDHLPVQDVFSASRVCRRLRAVTLASSQLWTQLEIHARRAEDYADVYLDGGYSCRQRILSNMTLVRSVIDRSKDKLLSLNVTVATEPVEGDIPREFIDQLKSFVDSVSHRLRAFHIQTGCESDLLHVLFHAQRWAFPELCELAVSASYDAYSPDIELELDRTALPRLRHLELSKDFHVKGLPPLPTLTVFSCDGAQVHDILRIVGHARGLERLEFGLKTTGPNPCSFEAARRDQEFVAALNAVPAVTLRAHGGQAPCVDICSFVDHLPRPRVSLDLVVNDHLPQICLCFDRVLAATHIVMLDAPKSIDIVVTDTFGRTTTVRMFDELIYYNNPRGENTQPLDWPGIPALDSLTSLRVDASIWRLVMAGFPRAPLLANVTLSLNDVSSLDSLRSPVELGVALWASEQPSPDEGLGLPEALHALGAQIHFEQDWPERPMPTVPAGTSLTITSDRPLSVDGWCVGDVMDLFGVDEVKLDGVVLEGDRAFAERALSD